MSGPRTIPIRKVGSSRTANIAASFDELVAILGPPNATDMDDPDKVPASWGFADESGREGFVWAYKVRDLSTCTWWSADGDLGLLVDLFGERVR